MSKNELVGAYRTGQMSRRAFIQRMAALGVSVAAASAYADLLAPASKAAAVVRAQSLYGTTTTTEGSTTTTTQPSTSTTTGSTTSTTPSSTTSTTQAGTHSTTATVEGSSTVAPGSSVTVAASGFAPNSTTTIQLFSDPVSLGTAKADAGGNVRATVTIPATTAAGQHSVVITGPAAAGGTNQATATITVTSGAAQIALTGTNTERLGALGAAAAGAGALFKWAERRTRPNGDTAEPS